MMKVTIHQPEHLPWLGFFDKARQADILVLLDHVQYRRRYFQNRNRIRGPQGELWLTVPVVSHGRYDQPIREVRIDHEGNPRWAEKNWKTLSQCYARAPHFDRFAADLESLYRNRVDLLVDLNVSLIRAMLPWLGIQPRILLSSELGVKESKGALMLEICRVLQAETYLSGISGREYLDLPSFAAAGIDVRIQEFHHPIYRQIHEPFQPCLSALDLLFLHGPEAPDILKGIGVETMEHVFE